ncbi:MAG: alpha/beta hydrolase [Segetibacter sp.]
MIIFVHGGGWVSHGKDDGKVFCTLFAKKGYVTASINYRLGIENPINEKTRGEAVYRGVQDIKAAIRYARSNTSLYKIDTGQLFIGGYSAGAVNAVHAAYWNENEVPQNIDKQKWGSLNNSGENLNFSSDVQAVYSIAGSIGDTTWIQSGEPPVVCVHSKTDNLIPYASGLDVYGIYVYGATSILQKATSVNIPVTIFTYENISHGVYLDPENFTTTTNAVNDFLYSRLKW